MTDKELLQQALRALVVAEAGLADIGDADREPGDDLAWCEARAAQALELPRAAIIALRAAIAQPDVKEFLTDAQFKAMCEKQHAESIAEWTHPEQSSQALQAIARLLQVHEGREPEDALKIAAAMIGAQPVQPACYVNSDELDNMLDDRTATIQTAISGHRKTPLYAAPQAIAQPIQPADDALETLMHYRCTHFVDEDGDGLPLLDALAAAFGDTDIGRARQEIELIADELEAIAQPAAKLLTPSQITVLIKDVIDINDASLVLFARAVEAAHGIGEPL